MKVGNLCYQCIKDLAKRTLKLIGQEKEVEEFEKIVDANFRSDITPPSIANKVLSCISERFKVEDPYERVKDLELKEAKKAYMNLKEYFREDLIGSLKLSAIGNSSDFFVDGNFSNSGNFFINNPEKIEKGIYSSRNILIIGDNVSDFVFDLTLIDYLERMGKDIYYIVREKPVQNDLSVPDVKKYGFDKLFRNFLSTGTKEVGLKAEDIKGKIKELWNGDTFIIAKGMGNYETITEFACTPVTYVMKVKCEEVARSTGYPLGSYLILYEGR